VKAPVKDFGGSDSVEVSVLVDGSSSHAVHDAILQAADAIAARRQK
jgi:hypothetical protein